MPGPAPSCEPASSDPGGARRPPLLASGRCLLQLAIHALRLHARALAAVGLTLDAEASFDVALANRMDAPTLIHWHGLTPPWPQDGVPDNPAALLKPDESRSYAFPAGPGGTHWMHAHTLQEQSPLAAPLIVHTAADRRRDKPDAVILLHDFSFTPPEDLLARLTASSAGGMPRWGMGPWAG